MIASLATGLLGMVVVLTAWLAVQQAWRRAFPAVGEPDALAGRTGCGGCARSEECERPAGACAPAEEERR